MKKTILFIPLIALSMLSCSDSSEPTAKEQFETMEKERKKQDEDIATINQRIDKLQENKLRAIALGEEGEELKKEYDTELKKLIAERTALYEN